MIKVELTTNEHCNMGDALFHFWYYNDDLQALAPGLMGSPSHGGEHSTSIRSESTDDLVAFLKLFAEKYPFIATEIELLIDTVYITDKGVINLKHVLRNRKPYLLWRSLSCHKKFVAPNDKVYDKETLVKLNFQAYRDILLGRVDIKEEDLQSRLLRMLKDYDERQE